MSMWYEATSTVWTANGQTTYINFPADRLPQDKPSQEWVKRARDRNEYPVIVTRAALAALDAKVLTDAKVTVDVAAPLTGTKDEKEAAVQVKLATPITPEEWDKVEAVLGKVEPVEAEEKPITEKPEDKHG